AHICEHCVEQAHGIVMEELKSQNGSGLSDEVLLKKPQEIRAFLDGYVIGQEQTKKVLSVAVYNHYKRLLQQDSKNDVEIEKSNIIIVSRIRKGKTLIEKTNASILNVSMAIVDDTVITKAHYVTKNVEDI